MRTRFFLCGRLGGIRRRNDATMTTLAVSRNQKRRRNDKRMMFCSSSLSFPLVMAAFLSRQNQLLSLSAFRAPLPARAPFSSFQMGDGYRTYRSDTLTMATTITSEQSDSKHIPQTQQQQQQQQQQKHNKTQYTIDDTVCSPTLPHVLEGAVNKACASIDKYLEKKPIAAHTKKAFDTVRDVVASTPATVGLELAERPIVLDSGCGTGRSSILLGEMFPDHLVIGVDRSFVRLSKQQRQNEGNGTIRRTSSLKSSPDNSEADEKPSLKQPNDPICQLASDNVVLIRAELVDFWRCCLSEGWNERITHHYLLYPNPYPKPARLTQRWYAHPSFPLLLGLGPSGNPKTNDLIVRSNWKGYLTEFAKSVELAHEFCENQELRPQQTPDTERGSNGVEIVGNFAKPYLYSAREGPVLRTNQEVAMTNFERKYDTVGEPTYELRLIATHFEED